MRILVTGNLGFVGPHLVGKLLESGHQVVGCDLALFPNSICDEFPKPQVQWKKDFRNLSVTELQGFDAIAHLGGISNDPMGDLIPGLTMEINGLGSIALAEKAKEAKVATFAFASSCSIYGSSGTAPKTEVDPTEPLSEYAESKLFAENGLAELNSDSFNVFLLRNATAFGHSPIWRSDLVVNDLSAGICAFGTAEVKSDGSPWRPLIHCADMARAFQLFIENRPGRAAGIPVNIGFQDENFQVRTIAELVQKFWKDSVISYAEGAVADPRNYKVDFSLLKSIFPYFEPEHPLDKGIQELRDFLIKIKYSPEDRKNRRFVRLMELKENIEQLEG
jgi:nucleoside-diphosphate-sugar epimerase